MTRRRWPTLIAAAIGLAAIVGLWIWADGADVAALLAAGGWGAILLALWRAVPLACDTVAWNRLFRPERRRPFLALLKARWIGESVNTLLPVAQVGGEVVRARLAKNIPPRGHTAGETPGTGLNAGASVVVDFLMGLLTQVLFTLAGLAIIVKAGSGAETDTPLTLIFVTALAGLFFLIVTMALRSGLMERLAARMEGAAGGSALAKLVGGAAALHGEVAATLRRRGDILGCALAKLCAWAVRSGETWLAFWLLGIPISPAEAVAIEAMTSAARSAAFAVPGALGVQEGGLLLAATLLGVDAEAALAVALMKRAREVLSSAPGLAAWAHSERGALFRLLTRAKEP